MGAFIYTENWSRTKDSDKPVTYYVISITNHSRNPNPPGRGCYEVRILNKKYIKKDTKNTIKTKQKQSEKTNPNAWYTNKWVKTGGAVIVGGLIWYIYDQNNKSSDKKQDVETIWIPGDEGRTGGSRQEDRTGGSKQ